MISLRFLFLSLAILFILSACGSSYSDGRRTETYEELHADLEDALDEEIIISAHCPTSSELLDDRRLFRFTVSYNEWKALFFVIADSDEMEKGKSYKITGTVITKIGELEGTPDHITIEFKKDTFFIEPTYIEELPEILR